MGSTVSVRLPFLVTKLTACEGEEEQDVGQRVLLNEACLMVRGVGLGSIGSLLVGLCFSFVWSLFGFGIIVSCIVDHALH